MQEVLRVAPDYSNAAGLSRYGWQTLRDAQCEDIIEKLPEEVDTVIGSSGTYVSGGEAQRIAIALSRLSKGKTVIMIAHRLSTVSSADRICVLQEGKIVESGSHEKLLADEKLYAHMWEEYNKSVHWKVGVQA